jgi:predicted phosphodiesterase
LTRIAFLADIHGNLPALEAVAKDLSAQSPDAVFLVGDQINRCPWNNEVMDLIASQGWPSIYGNHEFVIRNLAAPHDPWTFDDRQRFPDLWWSMQRLEARHMETIRGLPPELSLEFGEGAPIHVVHGVPGDPFRGVYPDTDEREVAKAFAAVGEPVIVCAHTHRPLRRTVGNRRIFNGGSVGMPYNGDTRAQYLILSCRNDEWTPAYRRVQYPLESVRAGFKDRDLHAAFGAFASVYLRTIETGDPWASDFGHWLNSQPPHLQHDIERAFVIYKRLHGPGRWSFLEGSVSDSASR